MEAILIKKEEESEKEILETRVHQKIVVGIIGPDPILQDVTGAEYIEVHISADGKTLWVNNEFTCLLRVCRIKKLFLRDDRSRKE